MNSTRLLLLVLSVLALRLPAQQHTAESPQILEGPQSPGLAPRPVSDEPAAMTNATILRMHAAGLSDEVIVDAIATQPGHFTTDAETLISLKQAGLTSPVLSAMINKARRPLNRVPLTTAAPAVILSPVNEIGVYYKDARGQWTPMESEIVHIKSGGFIKSTLTHNIIKEDRNGVVSGRESKLLLPRPIEFLI